MSILKFLSGPDPEKLEKKGDALLASGSWGEAKIEYERALEKAGKKGLQTPDLEMRLSGKIAKAKESLSAAHQKTAEEYMDGGYFDEACTYLSLAGEITSDEARILELAKLRAEIEALRQARTEKEVEDEYYGLAHEEAPEDVYEQVPDERFHALCAALPPEIQDVYLSCDENFRAGYLALNDGAFEAAAIHLAQAMADNSDPCSYIPLELATAYLHLGRLAEARDLLTPFLANHPESIAAYQLLCDICWEEKDFEQANALIDSVPEPLADDLAIQLLRGETRFHAGDFEAAKAQYQSLMKSRGWETEIALALARTHEAAGELENARLVYREIMGRCTNCRTKTDPVVKHKYAELSFAAGIYDTHVLELYLALAQELPTNAPGYYARVSRIYAEQGNETEAARFRVIARRASE